MDNESNFENSNFQMTGKNMDLGQSLQDHIRTKTNQVCEKYIGRPTDISVTLTKTSKSFICDITTHLSSGTYLSTEDEENDPYDAFEKALEKLEKRIRRHTKKLRHHNRSKTLLAKEKMMTYIISPSEDSADSDDQIVENYDDDFEDNYDETLEQEPLIIAEIDQNLLEISLAEAVFQLGIIDENVLAFKNKKTGKINMVYKRKDKNIGWISS